ncbi:MAG: class I SAM-dependent methyltransferase [Planctomycetota bacterium]
MTGYYSTALQAERLRRCYEVAPPRVRRYLAAEVEYAAREIGPGERVLDLGCGYGRLLGAFATRGARVLGIDTSLASLCLARPAARVHGAALARMDAARLALAPGAFDVVLALQNGVSAFHADPSTLLREAVRVAAPGGRVLFSTYAAAFWPERLAWFEIQAAHGLVGEIDRARTGDGVIVCRDGFTASTARPEDFRAWAAELGLACELAEVDGSSLFCTIRVPAAGGTGGIV